MFIAICPAMVAIASLPFGTRPAATEVVGVAIAFTGVALLVSDAGFSAYHLRPWPGGIWWFSVHSSPSRLI